MTRFWRLRCLRVVEVIPEYDICEGDWSLLNAHLKRDGEDGRATVLLGNPSGGCEFDMQTERESLSAGDAVTVVLPSRERVRFPGWLRAPRLAAVTLVVLGAGVSIRLLKRPGERDGVRAGATTRHFASAPTARHRRGASRSAHPRAKVLPRQGAERQRRGVHRRPGTAGQAGEASRTAISGVPARSWRAPERGQEDDVPRVDGVPGVNDASTPARSEAQSPAPHRRPPCLPGTLGC